MYAEELIEIITNAFHGVEQPKGITLYVAEAHDDYDYENEQKHQRKDYIGAWQDVPDEHIEECQHALSYVDKLGMRFYLPAYMVWTLRNLDSETCDLDHALYSLDNHPNSKSLAEYHKERFSLFNPQQMEACALFIKFCAEDENDLTDAYFAQKKFERYWNQYVRTEQDGHSGPEASLG